MKIESLNSVPEIIGLEAARMAGVISQEVRDVMDEMVNLAAQAGVLLFHPKRTAQLQESIAKLVQLAINREFRTPQAEVASWVKLNFGDEQACSPAHRAIRHLEEVIELAQACGVSPLQCHSLVQHVFYKPMGDKFKELGGAMTTLLALAQACKVDIWEAYQVEVDRIQSMPPEFWQARNKAKDDAGFKPGAIAAAQNDAPDGSAQDRLAWLQARPAAIEQEKPCICPGCEYFIETRQICGSPYDYCERAELIAKGGRRLSGGGGYDYGAQPDPAQPGAPISIEEKSRLLDAVLGDKEIKAGPPDYMESQASASANQGSGQPDPGAIAAQGTIHVFQLNDCDWVAAASLDQAIEFYLTQVGTPADQITPEKRAADYAEYIEEPHQVGLAAMNKLMINCEDTGTKRTFADELNRLIQSGASFPLFFASTEF